MKGQGEASENTDVTALPSSSGSVFTIAPYEKL